MEVKYLDVTLSSWRGGLTAGQKGKHSSGLSIWHHMKKQISQNGNQSQNIYTIETRPNAKITQKIQKRKSLTGLGWRNQMYLQDKWHKWIGQRAGDLWDNQERGDAIRYPIAMREGTGKYVCMSCSSKEEQEDEKS